MYKIILFRTLLQTYLNSHEPPKLRIPLNPNVPAKPYVALNPNVPAKPFVALNPNVPAKPYVALNPNIPPKPYVALNPNVPAKPYVALNPNVPAKPYVAPKPYVPPKPYIAPKPYVPPNPYAAPAAKQPQLNDPRHYYTVKERLVLEPNRLYFAGKQHSPSEKDNLVQKSDLAQRPEDLATKLDSIQKPDSNSKRYDVVLTSYMRSGSTLTGMVLGHRSDCFYVYEPLWKVARWAYWRGNNSVCRADITECREVSPDERADPQFMDNQIPSYTASLKEAQQILSDIYDCQLDNFNRQVFSKAISMKLGGPSWNPIKSCIDKGGDQGTCLRRFGPQICNSAKHRVTKVLRLTTDQVEYLLQSRDNLKVIHLFRDPRAIMNSRIETKWYPSNDVSLLLYNAESLCKKMIYDHQKGKELHHKYPERFKFVYYEDLNDDPLNKVKSLYSYLGMDLDESKYSVIKDISVFKQAAGHAIGDRTKNTAFWWRKTLDWEIITQIDSLCSQVYKALGYVQFSRHRDLRNLTLSSVDIPPEYLI